MSRNIKFYLAIVIYLIGLAVSVYVGGWVMLIQPIRGTITAYTLGTLTLRQLVINVIKCISSLTVAGLIWCIGYIAYNHFKGAEDPDWEALEAKRMKRRDEDEKERQAS